MAAGTTFLPGERASAIWRNGAIPVIYDRGKHETLVGARPLPGRQPQLPAGTRAQDPLDPRVPRLGDRALPPQRRRPALSGPLGGGLHHPGLPRDGEVRPGLLGRQGLRLRVLLHGSQSRQRASPGPRRQRHLRLRVGAETARLPPAAASPGCGREYRRFVELCPCGYAEQAVRFARRPTDPTPGDLERRRPARGAQQRERVQGDCADAREAHTAAISEMLARTRESKFTWFRVKESLRLLGDRPGELRAAKARITINCHLTPVRGQGHGRKNPERPPPGGPLQVACSRQRCALTRQLVAEDRFLEQRTEASHRCFAKLLDRVCPPEQVTGWREPLELGRRIAGVKALDLRGMVLRAITKF